jgi:hypothetical protein
MYSRFADSKFFRRLPDGSIVVYDVIGDGDCALFDIFFHGITPENVFYIICQGVREYVYCQALPVVRKSGYGQYPQNIHGFFVDQVN